MHIYRRDIYIYTYTYKYVVLSNKIKHKKLSETDWASPLKSTQGDSHDRSGRPHPNSGDLLCSLTNRNGDDQPIEMVV